MAKIRPRPGIEPGTSCTQSKNHTTRPSWQMHRPGLEPGSLAWKASILTPILTMQYLDSRARTSDLRNYSPPLYQLSYIEIIRCRQDLNLRGQSPIDFKSISLTTRTRHLTLPTIIIFKSFLIEHIQDVHYFSTLFF